MVLFVACKDVNVFRRRVHGLEEISCGAAFKYFVHGGCLFGLDETGDSLGEYETGEVDEIATPWVTSLPYSSHGPEDVRRVALIVKC